MLTLALDRVLQTRATMDERRGRVVELRFFGGLSVDEFQHQQLVVSRAVR
jgi:hypothetical protein